MITTFYLIVLILSLFMIGRVLFINRRVDSLLMVSMFIITINCAGRYIMSISQSLDTAIIANFMIYIGSSLLPLLMIIMLARLCNKKFPLPALIILLLLSAVVLGGALTIGKYDIYYESVELIISNGYSYLSKDYGPLHVLHLIATGIEVAILLVYAVYAIIKRKQISYRTVITIIFIGLSVFVMYILEKVLSVKVSLTVIGYLMGVVFLIGYYERVEIYDMVGNISNSIDKLNEYGYITFDKKYKYVSSNTYIKSIFPEIYTWVVDQEVCDNGSYLYNEAIKSLKEWDGKDNISKTLVVGDVYLQMNIKFISHRKNRNEGFLLEFVDRTIENKYYNTIKDYNSYMEKEVQEKTYELKLQQEKTSKLFLQTVTALSEAVDAKDRYTSGHSKRVAIYAKMIAKRMGKSEEEQNEIYRAGLLHDVGKIRVPAEIINKSGKLTDEEYNLIKIHPVTGYNILKGISEDSFIAIAAKYHHERFDGKGYPNGLEGNKIPEIARIIGVADSYDAMASNRSYRNALPQEIVRSEIERGRGTQFDPNVADIMLQIIDEDKEYAMKQVDSMERRILSVDDEPMNNKIIAHIMQDEPMYTVVSATGGKEALNILNKQEFDLVLLDVNMPEMDGLETLKLIREVSNVPVVLMTSDKTLDLSVAFAEYGCDEFITKPFLPLLVKEIVHNMTEHTEL